MIIIIGHVYGGMNERCTYSVSALAFRRLYSKSLVTVMEIFRRGRSRPTTGINTVP